MPTIGVVVNRCLKVLLVCLRCGVRRVATNRLLTHMAVIRSITTRLQTLLFPLLRFFTLPIADLDAAAIVLPLLLATIAWPQPDEVDTRSFFPVPFFLISLLVVLKICRWPLDRLAVVFSSFLGLF